MLSVSLYKIYCSQKVGDIRILKKYNIYQTNVRSLKQLVLISKVISRPIWIKFSRICLVTCFWDNYVETWGSLSFFHTWISRWRIMQWLRFLKRKYRLFNIFYVQNLFWSLCPQFQECEAEICHFLLNRVIFCIFVTALSPRNNNYGTRKVFLKIKDIRNASLACIIESMLKNLILFLWNLGLDP